ncbi:MAG TPA: hypothetical protein VNP96_02340 [Solirubrobacterales bacterium]|nr:hypothetical protein [Solirubrobacterales bacterium]
MFRCSHCQTEYGGIRGVLAESCPRCVAGDDIAVRRSSASSAASAARETASWPPPLARDIAMATSRATTEPLPAFEAEPPARYAGVR